MISVCIPCYEMNGLGDKFLSRLLDSLHGQVFKEFEVVISDHSLDNNIENIAKYYNHTLDIKYIRNEDGRGKSSANINCAIKNSRYGRILPIFQDDFIENNNYLNLVSVSNKGWGFCNFNHTDADGIVRYKPMVPRLNPNLAYGTNTLGCPSVIYFDKDEDLYFDEKLVWLMDCEFYHRVLKKYGTPTHIDQYCMVIRLWGNSVSSNTSEEIKNTEYNYVKGKINV
jgi:glycosyltransferase involved in cell wall biosynthesis